MTRAIARLWLTCSLAFVAPLVAAADPVAPADVKAIRIVVEAQLDAFAADDAKRAFSYAAPAIREMFVTPEKFMAMVKSGYPAVYRPASVTFLNPEWIQGQLVQGVHLTDASGALWIAIYRFDRQPDKSWRISGCDVQPAAGKLT